MSSRAFRFAVVAATPSAERSWADTVRRIEGFGYSTVQVPDTLGTLATFPALAAAATATTTLRVGAYVIAAPNHRPAAVAHEALSVDVLSGGRLELGLGAGRPAPSTRRPRSACRSAHQANGWRCCARRCGRCASASRNRGDRCGRCRNRTRRS
jgi:alkanesulfonate monooxygenase SsuD/methylene tetrahydromethanopterin reductase-like flavin-dependent oxidoreductase (luciferase family)